MGLRPGEKIEPLGPPLTIVSVRREPLRAMLDDLDYGYDEVRREGFEGHPQYGHPNAAPLPWPLDTRRLPATVRSNFSP